MTDIFWTQWVLKPENSLVWHKEVLGWINKYSGVNKSQSRQLAHRPQ